MKNEPIVCKINCQEIFYGKERKPMSRKQRLKRKRIQAFYWHMEKANRLNPITGFDFRTDDLTGLGLNITTRCDGSQLVDICPGVAIGEHHRLSRLLQNQS